MATTDPAPKSAGFSIRLPRPLWIGLAAAVLVVVVGLRFGVPIYSREAAIRKIRLLGGEVSFEPTGPEWLRELVSEDYTNFFDEIECIAFRADQTTFHRRFKGNVEGLVLYATGPSVDDASLACIAGVPSLRALYLSCTNIGDAGMAHVLALHNLEELSISATDVSDAGCRLISQFPHLRELSIAESKITDAGLASLKDLKKLEVLYLDEFQVTADGIEILRGLPSLKAVRLPRHGQEDRELRAKALEALKRDLPGVEVN